MAKWALRGLMGLLLLMGALSLLLPPTLFLKPGSLTYDVQHKTFTYVRTVASVADLFHDCRLPTNFDECERIDQRWPLVYVKYTQNVVVAEDRHGAKTECIRPPGGAPGELWIQFEALKTVRYQAPNLDPCMAVNGVAVMHTYRELRLFGWFPLFWPLRTATVFPEIIVGDPPLRVGFSPD